MSAVIAKIKREDLLLEIIKVLGQWSDIDRNIFTQSHYLGRSIKAISRSLKLDIKQVTTTLKKCDSRLQASLRNFRKYNCDNFHMA